MEANLFCSSCGAPVKIGDRFCTNCGAPVKTNYIINNDITKEKIDYNNIKSSEIKNKKNPWVALLLSSLIVGLGQFYNGDYKKGINLLTIAVLGSIFTAGGMWFFAATYSMIDAFISAKKK